jgi:hypothetical protein
MGCSISCSLFEKISSFIQMGLVEKGPVIRSNLTYFCIFSLVINLFSTADFKFFVAIEIRGPLYSRRKPFLKP